MALEIISAAVHDLGVPVFGVTMLLWINLIMDYLAALALGTDRFDRKRMHTGPECRPRSLVTVGMAKMIAGQAACHLAVTLVLLLGGRSMLGLPDTDDGRIRLKTLVFNTYIWLQIFNLLK